MAKRTEPCITSDAEKFTNDFSWTTGWRTENDIYPLNGKPDVTDGPNNLIYNNDDIALNVSLSPRGIKELYP